MPTSSWATFSLLPLFVDIPVVHLALSVLSSLLRALRQEYCTMVKVAKLGVCKLPFVGRHSSVGYVILAFLYFGEGTKSEGHG